MNTFLKMENIVKDFPGVRAVNNVSIELREGEIHAILGHNGAGKTTLVKILSGAYKKDSGKIYLDDCRVDFVSPAEAIRGGIHMVYQELDLIPYLSGAENIYLGQGRFHNRVGLIDHKKKLKAAQDLISRFDVDIDLTNPVGELSVSKQQIISIAKAISSKAKIIIFDEPTSALNELETNKLFDVMRRLIKEKVTLILITHRLSEVFLIADRVTVMRDGKHVFTRDIADVTKEKIIDNMADNSAKFNNLRSNNLDQAEIILKCQNISDGITFTDISFDLHKGEVLGLTGLIGCGALEVARAIYGATRRINGTVTVNGEKVNPADTNDGTNKGMAFISDDRKRDGLILVESVKNNITIATLGLLTRMGFIDRNHEKENAEKMVDKLSIRVSDLGQSAQTLSGGNQQKVVLSKWLLLNSQTLILCEPTRGIDASTKAEIHNMIREFAANGKSILVVSSEIDEILETCDRVLVFYEGSIFGELDYKAFDREKIMNWMYGVK